MSDVLTEKERRTVELLRERMGEPGLATIGQLLPIIDRLCGELEKQPVYADTGERFMPGIDEAWDDDGVRLIFMSDYDVVLGEYVSHYTGKGLFYADPINKESEGTR